MKKTFWFLAITLLMIVALVSCGNTDAGKEKIEGVTFSDTTYTYDGTEKSVMISGNLPEGVSVSYSNAKATNAGTYNAVATLSGKGYETLVLKATLKINKADITGVTLNGKTVTYDGSEKSLAVEGTIPTGVSVSYTNEKATNAGTYAATASLEGANYNTLTLNAVLIINKADITGISADAEQSVTHDGEAHKPTFVGSVPNGVGVKYIFDETEYSNGVRAIGKYNAEIVFEGANYNTFVLSVEYSIKVNLSGLANAVIESFGSVPDVWSFLPDSFSLENRITTIPGGIDYSSFVKLSSLPKNGMGQQLNVVYGVLSKMQAATEYLNIVYGSMNIVKDLYTTFLDNNPTDHQTFTESAGAFTFTLAISEERYALSANVGSVEVIIYADLGESSYGAKIQLTETTVLKYTVGEETFSIALNILNANSTYIEFSRNENEEMVGLFYEYLSVGGVDIVATSAMIHVGPVYTTIIGTKGDFIPHSVSRNCEIYLNSTGEYIGGEVREDSEGVIYNTYWFPLVDVSGITNIKKIDEMNFPNPDTIYINDKTVKIKTKLYGGNIFSGKAGSRRFDIEFKTLYFYDCNEDGEYTLVETEVPMIFIQEEMYNTFDEDFASANSVAVSLQISNSKISAINYAYTVVLPIYDAVKDAVTREMIIEYCSK